jgi:tetratricopeptide (TPR) repeat protein
VTLALIGDVYRYQGNYTKAIEFFSQSLEILERIKGKESIETCETICYIGMAITQKGDFPLALQYLYKAV